MTFSSEHGTGKEVPATHMSDGKKKTWSRRRIAPEVRHRILDMRRRGFGAGDIAKTLGISTSSVYRNLPDEAKRPVLVKYVKEKRVRHKQIMAPASEATRLPVTLTSEYYNKLLAYAQRNEIGLGKAGELAVDALERQSQTAQIMQDMWRRIEALEQENERLRSRGLLGRLFG